MSFTSILYTYMYIKSIQSFFTHQSLPYPIHFQFHTQVSIHSTIAYQSLYIFKLKLQILSSYKHLLDDSPIDYIITYNKLSQSHLILSSSYALNH